MHTFFMFGKCSSQGLRDIADWRTGRARQIVEGLGGEIENGYALLGEYDLFLIVRLPRMADAMRAAVKIGQVTGITFSTCAATPLHEFDEVLEELTIEIESARMEAHE